MKVIEGQKIAAEIIERLKIQKKPAKYLAVFIFTGDEVAQSFVKQKEKTARELDLDFRVYELPVGLKNDDVRQKIRENAEHKTCGGVLVQLPAPEHLNRQYILNVIPPAKDPDVLGERSLGAFYAGRGEVLPPAAGVIEEILKSTEFKLASSRVAVVGAGFLVGRPIASWLMGQVKEIFVLDKGSDLSSLKEADLVISGTGEAGLIKTEMLKDGAGVIDFGYGTKEGKLKGDLDASGDLAKLSFYTPTPGGTGPMLVAKLFENFYILNAKGAG